MSLPLLPSVMLIALATLLASPAGADSIAFDFPLAANAVINTEIEPGQTVGDTDGNDHQIPLFDPSLGVLTGWQITFEGTYSIRISASAFGSAPADPVALDFSGATGFGLTVKTIGGFLALGEIGPFSTGIELCTGIGTCSASVVDAATGTVSFASGLLDPNDPPNPAAFPNLHATTFVTTTAHDASGWLSLTSSTGAELLGTGTVTYFYTPEPGAGILTGLGVAALGGARRRRRGPVGG